MAFGVTVWVGLALAVLAACQLAFSGADSLALPPAGWGALAVVHAGALMALTSDALERRARARQRVHRAVLSLTERNAELLEANRRLQRLEELKRDFLNATSHELRTPLSTIVGFSEFLEDGLGGPLSCEQAEYVHQIQGAAKRLRRMVDDLLDSACLDAGVFELARREVDLAGVVARVADAMQPEARAAEVGLALAGEWPEMRLEADPMRLEQILTNLIGNGLKFTPPGGRVSLSCALDAERCLVRVQDTGIGIAPQHRARLFEKFYQVDPGLSRTYGGTGLGLALARGLAEAHRGDLRLESRPGEGSCFVLSLPRGLGAEGALAEVAALSPR